MGAHHVGESELKACLWYLLPSELVPSRKRSGKTGPSGVHGPPRIGLPSNAAGDEIWHHFADTFIRGAKYPKRLTRIEISK